MSNSLFLAALAGFGASFATLLLFATVDRIRSALASPRGPLSPAGGRLVFEGRYLVASDGPAKAAFDKCPAAGDDWDRAVSLLGGDYAGLDRSCPPVSLDPGELLSAGGEERISISRVDGLVTLAFSPRAPADAPLQTGPGDREAERETLRITAGPTG